MANSTFKIEVLEKVNDSIPLSGSDLDQVVGITQRGFGAGMSRREVCDHVLPLDIVYLVRQENDIAGFASLDFEADRSYFSGIVIDPAHQKAGMATALTQIRTEKTIERRLDTLWTRTQNPIVEHTMHRVLSGLQERGTIKEWNVRRTLLAGRYGRMLTAFPPKSNDLALNTEYEKLNYAQGDAYCVYVNLVL